MNLRVVPPFPPSAETEAVVLSLLAATLLATERILRTAHPRAFRPHQCLGGLAPEQLELRTLVEHTQRLRADIHRRQATLCEHDADQIEEESDDAIF